MKKLSYWKDHDTWVCSTHLPPVQLPASLERCYMVDCAPRPDMAGRPDKVEVVEETPEPEVAVCAYELCAEPAREGSKYCSKRCSNRNARRAYKRRQAEEARRQAEEENRAA